VAQKYHFINIKRKDVDLNKIQIHSTTTYYDLMQSPSKEGLSTSFDSLTYQNEADWEDEVKKGWLITVDFPNRSRLHLSAQMSKDDQNYVSRAFWDQRWQRYGKAVLPYLYAGIAPPIILLVLGSSLVWVGRGFAH
jgi:hypothetical protein